MLSYLRLVSVISLILFNSGCGAYQLWSHSPNTEKLKWKEWSECFQKPLSHEGVTHSVFCLKGSGSKQPVLLLHEMEGLTSETFHYAMELSEDFTVYVPMLFGDKGEDSLGSGWWAYLIGSEWTYSTKKSPSIVEWLREVVLKIQAQHESLPIRIIGNCMTGSLPLALLNNPNVDAIVVAQPALPLKIFGWYTDDDFRSLGLSDRDWELAKDSNAKVLAVRFETDWISHPQKLNTLQALKHLTESEICARDYQPQGELVRAHSTLIGERNTFQPVRDLSRKKRDEVRNFLLHFSEIAVESHSCSSKQTEAKAAY